MENPLDSDTILHATLTLLRDTFLTLTFENDEQVIQKMVDLHDSLAQSMDGTSSEWMMANMIQPIPTLFAKHSVERGGNVLGLDRAVENLVCMLNLAGKSPVLYLLSD